jgi:hypothetical protein
LFYRIKECVMTNTNERAIGTALAGGVLAAATLEALFDKGLLTLDEARAVLDKTMIDLGSVGQAEGAVYARRLIASLQSGKFSAHR